MNVLVTGANGQLGSEIKDCQHNFKELNVVYADIPDLDICNEDAVNTFITINGIEAIINCAAYTAVDKAEGDAQNARKVNAKGVLNLVKAMENVKGKIIHISTDYVFDGTKPLPYNEEDTVSPIGFYGKTKREGELAVINSSLEGIVIRTSWLYSAYGNNFVKTMIRLGSEKEKLNVIFDQIGSPTYAGDLANTCLVILSNEQNRIDKAGKVYHFSNEGVASWYDFATAVMKINKLDCEVLPLETKDYPTLAKRPHYSVLNKTKIKKNFKITIPYWRDSLEKCIQKLNS
ncbi:dTDP-4-dehydrorhamnose reductase [uncultured Polaribacter sp.]|uniref:dTDP-4-dehydrorhamnose reductase n=1 Tax=uncultured Polaribacter sp. TaxID=174711 RepID=UPI00261B4FA5|nr:dTDP-4-dehydrorhamnose reductase [uncultured Polaribacter sp.]